MTRAAKQLYPRVSRYVALHARRRPDHPAVIGNGRLVSYAALDRDLRAMTRALGEFGLTSGNTVAVGHVDTYVQLLIVFGFENLGVITGSFRPSEGPGCHALLASAALTLTDNPAVAAFCRSSFVLTEQWMAAVLAAPAPASVDAPPAPPEEVAVVARSSGTSGRPKRMLVTHGMLRPRLAQRLQVLGLTSRSRYFAAMHLGVGAMYHSASACLRLGATLMFDGKLSLLDALEAYRPTLVTLMPFHLCDVVEALSTRAVVSRPLLPELVLHLTGARLDQTLRNRALELLAGELRDSYGSNEAFLISAIDSTGVGTLTREMEAEVVDSAGRPVPFGDIGDVRVRGAGIVRGYVDDEAATAEMFRGGWFYPGDLGMLVASRRLKLVGRRIDVLNIDGMKIGCADLEDVLRRSAPVRDVALLQGSDGTTRSLIVVCVVPDGSVDMDQLTTAILPLMQTRFAIKQVDSIPRTAEGKIKRRELELALAQARPSQA